ncbi:hypothetical protein BJ742DRAFT_808848 [Cladochytrium replicatum]|nr:hypothetical protein BJ742DRAFT_808848 [Cladochytrium replicatum]
MALQNSTAANSNISSTTCLALQNSTICNSWAGASIPVPPGWEIASFDQNIRVSQTSVQRISDFNQIYGCRWNGSRIRYGYSYTCAGKIFAAADRRCLKNIQQNSRLLCYSTCMTYLASVKSLFDDPSICFPVGTKNLSQSMATARSKNLANIGNVCLIASTNSSGCVDGVPIDRNSCGFDSRSSTEGQVYCNSLGSSDSCCSRLNQLSDQSNSDPLPVIYQLIVVVILAFVLMVVLTVLVFLLPRRLQRKEHNERESLSLEKRYSYSNSNGNWNESYLRRYGSQSSTMRAESSWSSGKWEESGKEDHFRNIYWSKEEKMHNNFRERDESRIVGLGSKSAGEKNFLEGTKDLSAPQSTPPQNEKRFVKPPPLVVRRGKDDSSSLVSGAPSSTTSTPLTGRSFGSHYPLISSSPSSITPTAGQYFSASGFPRSSDGNVQNSEKSEGHGISSLRDGKNLRLPDARTDAKSKQPFHEGNGKKIQKEPVKRINHKRSVVKRYLAIHPYSAKLSDEVSLDRGHVVLIRKVYNDGWVNGINLTTGQEGTFPVACTTPMEESDD